MSTQPLDIENLFLERGSHDSREKGMCALEATAWRAGEQHSDHPKCACPVLAAFVRRLNDRLDDEPRQKLKPYIDRLIGTAGSKATSRARAWVAVDWLTRECAPVFLDVAKLPEFASGLRSLAPIIDTKSLAEGRPAIAKAREAANSAKLANYSRLRSAAAADAYADAYAYDAAAAHDTAAAAYAAAAATYAYDAAAAAAYTYDAAAARRKIKEEVLARMKPTLDRIQQSTFELLDRMILAGSTSTANSGATTEVQP